MMPENVPVSFGVPSKCIVISTIWININKNDSEASIKPILAVVRAFCCFQDKKCTVNVMIILLVTELPP